VINSVLNQTGVLLRQRDLVPEEMQFNSPILSNILRKKEIPAPMCWVLYKEIRN